MKLLSLETINKDTNEKYTFSFGQIDKGQKVVTTKGVKLDKWLEFALSDSAECAEDVVVTFVADDVEYSLRKTHGEDGNIKATLRKREGGKLQTIARGKNIYAELDTLTGGELGDLIKYDYISDRIINNFKGNLAVFRDVELLLDVSSSVAASTEELRAKTERANNNLSELATVKINTVSRQQIEEYSRDLDAVTAELNSLNRQLAELKGKEATSVITAEILSELASCQSKYQQLTAKKEQIEELRAQLAARDSMAALVPKLSQLETIAKQRAEYEKQRYAVVSELEWQENELSSVVFQLDDKVRESAAVLEKRSKIDIVNQELQTIAGLHEKNKELNEQLIKVSEQVERYAAERVVTKNKLVAIENKINDLKSDIEKYKVPNQSIGEMLEAVRVDVKIDEVQSQIDKLQSEVNMKESQIAEKESNLVLQVKRFKSVVELDVTVAPVKAKDTILQVLDSKYRKLELVNTQLLEKQRNFQRAYEDSRFQTLQVEHSIATLTAELDKVVSRKQEEFKREVLLNSQKVYTDDASSVFAVTTKLSDEEVDTLKQDIERRNVTKHSLSERSAELQGRIDEIGRQVAINNAEMATLQTERNNINNRYNEIVASNRNENVFHYLKALESNNGTRYLLDVQQDAVKSEAELAEAKRALDNARTRLAGLRSRLRYLLETQQTLDSAGGHALEQLIVTNDQIKDNLSDIGEGLSANYEQYRILSQQLEDNELKAARVNEQMVELSKTIKVNVDQIALSTEKAKKLAGTEDIEEALNNFRYELDDVESEKQMLTESKMSVEKDVFKKRLELEKLQFMFESKSKEYDELLSVVQVELNVNGIDQSTVKLFKFDEDTNEMRKTIADYDQQRVLLSERIENYYQLLKSQSGDAAGVDNALDISQKVAEIQTKIDVLAEKQAVLLEQRATAVSMYMAAASDKIKLAMATVEAKSLSDVRRLLKQNEIIKILVEDKIKAIVEPAGKLLNTFVDGSYHLVVDGTYVSVRDGMNVLTFDELTTDMRYAVYIALLLALTGPTSDRWLIFEEKPSITRPLLSSIMSRANVAGVTDVVKAEVAAQTAEP